MPIDFKYLMSPEGKAAAQKSRNDRELLQSKKEASQLRMIAHLVEQVDNDEISNAWEREFIRSLDAKSKPGFCYLTDKQDEVLMKLFEKY